MLVGVRCSKLLRSWSKFVKVGVNDARFVMSANEKLTEGGSPNGMTLLRMLMWGKLTVAEPARLADPRLDALLVSALLSSSKETRVCAGWVGLCKARPAVRVPEAVPSVI